MKFYFGTSGWGWKLYGIGYGTKWFLGFSLRHDNVVWYGPNGEIEAVEGK